MAINLARRLLHNMRKSIGIGQRAGLPSPAWGVEELRKMAYGEGDTDHQQQELFLLVVARLAIGEVFGA